MQVFRHPRLGAVILTGKIRNAPAAPYFLEIIVNAKTYNPKVTCMPIGELNACWRFLPEAERDFLNLFHSNFWLSCPEGQTQIFVADTDIQILPKIGA